jgi:hypothetical protein
MAIDKKTFRGGMNKDVDERLLAPDQYIHGENIRNLYGEEGDAGTISPTPSTVRVGASFEFPFTSIGDAEPTAVVCTGTVRDESSRKLYWFASEIPGTTDKEHRDWILEYDEVQNTINIIFEEFQGPEGILNLNKVKKIHSIDVINSTFLTWTTGVGTPKKLNIKKARLGYAFYTHDSHRKTFTDNNMASATAATELNSYGDSLVIISNDVLDLEAEDVIFVEQDPGFSYHEYNGYAVVEAVSDDGKSAVISKDFISNSPATPGSLWKVAAWDTIDGSYTYPLDPRLAYWPDAFSNIYKHVKEQYINVHKRGPRDKPTHLYSTDSTRKKNDLFTGVWQFAYRYLYDDDELSALSLISNIEVPEQLALNSVVGSSYAQSIDNRITITIPNMTDGQDNLQSWNTDSGTTGSSSTGLVHSPHEGLPEVLSSRPTNIKAIEVYAREGNNAPWTLIETKGWYSNICTEELLPGRDTNQAIPWDSFEIVFYNDGIYQMLSSRDGEKLYDWVPHTAETQTVIDSSSMLYANVTDGFDIACEMKAAVNASYISKDDEEYGIAGESFPVTTGSRIQAYINQIPASEATSWGSPDALHEGDQSTLGSDMDLDNLAPPYNFSNPCPGLDDDNALITWPGNNGSIFSGSQGWDDASNAQRDMWQRARVIAQFDLSQCPVEGGFVPLGTSFTSSGNMMFIYRHGSTFSGLSGDLGATRYGMGHAWEGVNVSIDNPTTTLAQFGASIAAAFAALPDVNISEGQPAGYEITDTWKGCEVFDDGTFYSEAGNPADGLAGQTVYVYFRATSRQAHGFDLLVLSRFRKFTFNHVSAFHTIPPTQTAFKTGAFHNFGLVYGNNRNQVSFVNKSETLNPYVKFLTERTTLLGTESYATGQTDNLGLPVMKWAIDHAPPAWAEWYKWVYSGNTSVEDYLQFTSERVATNLSNPSDNKIYLNLNSFKGSQYSYMKQGSPKIDYVFGEGDRIRFISNSGGIINEYIDIPIQEARVYSYMTEETDLDPAISNPTRGFWESKFESPVWRKKYMEGYYISFDAPSVDTFRYQDVTVNTDGGYRRLFFEIYNPKKKLEEGPVYYYGLTDKLPIEKNVSDGTRYHTGAVNQDISIGTPASGIFRKGDTYFKGRLMVHERESLNLLHFAPRVAEGTFINDFISSESYNKGRKHAFNPYVKAETRPTTVYYSGAYLPSSNVNGLSEFNPIDMPFKEFSISYGPIEKVLSRDSDLLLFQRNKVSRVMVQKQLLMGATGDSNVALSDKILSEATPYAGEHGPAFAGESVQMHGSNVYFADPVRAEICRLGANGITAISNNGMKHYFTDFFRKHSHVLGAHDYHEVLEKQNFFMNTSGIDPASSEFIYAPTSRTHGDGNIFPVNPLGFYEGLNKFVSFYTYGPEGYSRLGSNMYSFNGAYPYLHNQGLTVLSFYDKPQESYIKTAFNANPSTVKIFNNLSLEGSSAWNPGMLKSPDTTSFLTGSFEKKEGVYYLPIRPGTRTGDYEDLPLDIVGIAESVVVDDYELTLSEDGEYNFILDLPIYALTNGIAYIYFSITEINANVLTVSPVGNTWANYEDHALVQVASTDTTNEGERIRGVYATIDLSYGGVMSTSLYSINADVEYSALSYKNN